MKFVAILAIICAIAAIAVANDDYIVEASYQLPYIPLDTKISAASLNGNYRLSYYDDLDYSIYRYDLSKQYYVFTEKDAQRCRIYPIGADDGQFSVLPDVSVMKYIGEATVKGFSCDHFQQIVVNGAKTNTYDYYSLASNGQPIRYHMMGYNTIFGSHYDEYIMDYGLFSNSSISSEYFDIPELCKGVEAEMHAEGVSMMPFIQVSPKHVKTSDLALAYIEEHNHRHADVRGFKMSHNKFAHMSWNDFERTMLGTSAAKNSHASFTYEATHDSSIPDSWDWRDHGVVSSVKDQGSCGSCWTFAMTGSLEGVYAAKFGELSEFSQQELVDCGWTDNLSDWDNNGCEGGVMELGYEWAINNGGVSYLSSYPYKMVDDYCKAGIKGVTFTTYANVTEGDEEALKEVVYTNGPVGIAMDVTPDLVYYGSGVFSDSACGSTRADVNHGVLVVGYGTDANQGDYWIIKNSWSTHWGDDGYFKLARNAGNMCGVAAEAVYVPQAAMSRA